ncbi:MT-A70 family protein [Oxytricha trifallax]|uniref:mRNA m(6)A methyltransferase n=1 Tax=Oxytricha trifallax TaxID=1172189 RepID=A0A073HYP1_9SPIT|nr:MT-A70 family protein [Oxytricha trifallax]
MEEAINIMNQKGYEKCDILVWIKLNQDKTLYNNIGYYLRHIAEFCIIFRKKGPFQKLKSRTVLHFHSNIIIEKARKSCQKPESFYQLVEEMIPDNKYLDVFARQCNQRDRWFSVGDQSIEMPEELRS